MLTRKNSPIFFWQRVEGYKFTALEILFDDNTMISLERPFGVALWPIFDQVVLRITNYNFVPSKFLFIEGEVPFSTLPEVLTMITIYYIVIFGGNFVWKAAGWKPLVLNGLFQVHNLVLTIISLTLLLCMVEQLVPIIGHHGLFYAICNIGAWTQPLVCLYYLNYLTKFCEFLDTVFLVVKQKRLTFLHTYHHGATALLCYTQLVGITPISWVPITLNLGVHVVMYWYYFLAARGIRVWWKEWVTRFQIIQFILDLGFVYFATYNKVVHNYFQKFTDVIPYCGDCHGGMGAAYAGCLILSSYLLLFIAFYIEVYRKRGSKKSKKVKLVSGGVAAQVNEYVHVSGRSDTPEASQVKLRRT